MQSCYRCRNVRRTGVLSVQIVHWSKGIRVEDARPYEGSHRADESGLRERANCRFGVCKVVSRPPGDWCARANYTAALEQRTRLRGVSRLSPTLPPGGRQPTYFETCNPPWGVTPNSGRNAIINAPPQSPSARPVQMSTPRQTHRSPCQPARDS